ncbi:MAG: class I SAM-dependent methyltransferase [Betaproteobacteria bacterium]|nr:class I SAM-dependent methyltransferase [Betaproteobacteria bacterium]
MKTDQHWEQVYRSRSTTEVSWYRAHLEHSLESISRIAPNLNAAILDVGAGASTLVDDLLSAGYTRLTVLDIAASALESTRSRLGRRAAEVNWLVGNVLDIELPAHHFDIWHDRAVFHFLTSASDREAYVAQMTAALRPGGHVLIATFGPEGPLRCSGLEVVRYDAQSLSKELGKAFRLIDWTLEHHETPAGATQQFLHALFAGD